MSDLRYSILELEQPDLALKSAVEELERRASVVGLSTSEALNWVLTIPGLDEFLLRAKQHKESALQ